MRSLIAVISLVLLATACSKSKGGGTPVCIPETDAAYCSRINGCETPSAFDNCNLPRVVSCGACQGGTDACVSGTCKAPLCSSFSYAAGVPLTTLNDVATQDAIAGCSASGNSMLVQRSPGGCGGPFQLFIADALTPGTLTYSTSAVLTAGNLAAMQDTVEATLTLSSDGRAVIGVATGGQSLLSSSRSGAGSSTFGVPSSLDFTNLSVTDSALITSPVLSADGLAIYYTVSGSTVIAQNGIYESVRSSTAVPFPAGTLMPAAVQAFSSVTGVSADRMALFVTVSFTTSVLTRRSINDPFATPVSVPGFRVHPVGDCSTLVGTCTLAGCPGEEVCSFARQ